MNPSALRLIGIIFMAAAAAVAVLNLGRVADLGMTWLVPLLIVCGAISMLLARRAKR